VCESSNGTLERVGRTKRSGWNFRTLRGIVPQNALVYTYLSLQKLLPQIDLMITHGGAGTVNEGLSQGVPLIVLPLAADQPEIAQRCVQAGVGLGLNLKNCTPEMLRLAVWEVLHNPKYRENARRIQNSYRTYTGPEAAANLLEYLALTKNPVENVQSYQM
jgi:MGT family glycosyltransferase